MVFVRRFVLSIYFSRTLTFYDRISGTIGVMNVPYLFFLALNRDGVLKMNESAPGVLKPTDSASADEKTQTPKPQRFSIFSFFYNAFELLINMRGLGWQFGTGTGLFVAEDPRDTSSKYTFLRDTLRNIFTHYLIADVCNYILVYYDVRKPGGSLFGRGRNPVESAIISAGLTMVTSVFMVKSECRSQLGKLIFQR